MFFLDVFTCISLLVKHIIIDVLDAIIQKVDKNIYSFILFSNETCLFLKNFVRWIKQKTTDRSSEGQNKNSSQQQQFCCDNECNEM